MRKKVRLTMLIIGFLIIVWLFSSGIQDLILSFLGEMISIQITKFITLILTVILVFFMFKIPPFDELGKLLDKLEKKSIKK